MSNFADMIDKGILGQLADSLVGFADQEQGQDVSLGGLGDLVNNALGGQERSQDQGQGLF